MKKSILPGVWEIPEIFHRRVGNSVGRQRPMLEAGHLLLVLHAPPSPDDDEREGRFFWRDETGAWRSSGPGNGEIGLKKHIDDFETLIDQLERDEATAKTSDELFQLLDRLTPLHRAICNLHSVLQEARKLVEEDSRLVDLRNQAYDLERNADLLLQGVKNSLEFTMAKKAEEQAKSSHQMALASHRLNILVAFFFPIATLSAVFGVNMHHGLESPELYPLPIVGVLILGLLLGGILTALINKKQV